MNIGRSTFDAHIASVEDAIKSADFLSFDCEFSGLADEMNPRANRLDTLDTRLAMARRATSKFMLLQLGVCAFKWDAAKASFRTQAFNFPAFPRFLKAQGRENAARTFLCQPSSLEFLSAQGFDFNAWIADGNGWIDTEQEEHLRRSLEKKRELLDAESDESAARPPRPDDIKVEAERDVAFVRDLEARAKAWAAKMQRQEADAQGAEDWEPEALVLDPMNGFLRRLCYQTVEKILPTVVRVSKEAADNEDLAFKPVKRLRLSFLGSTPEARRARRAAACAAAAAADAAYIEKQVGLRRVVDAVRAATTDLGTPLVGHNCLLDLLHVSGKLASPFPAAGAGDAASLAAKIHDDFKVLFDTRQLICRNDTLYDQLKSASLGGAFKASSSAALAEAMPAFHLAEGHERYAEALEEGAAASAGPGDELSAAHEAGFDALMTGVLFARCVALLGGDVAALFQARAETRGADSTVVKREMWITHDTPTNPVARFANQVHLLGVARDSPLADGLLLAPASLRGVAGGAARQAQQEQSIQAFQSTLLVRGFPRGVGTHDIRRLFSSFMMLEAEQPKKKAKTGADGAGASGAKPNHVLRRRQPYVQWLGDGAVLVSLFDASAARRALAAKRASDLVDEGEAGDEGRALESKANEALSLGQVDVADFAMYAKWCGVPNDAIHRLRAAAAAASPSPAGDSPSSAGASPSVVGSKRRRNHRDDDAGTKTAAEEGSAASDAKRVRTEIAAGAGGGWFFSSVSTVKRAFGFS